MRHAIGTGLNTSPGGSSLCLGSVTHVRHEPVENAFTYRACWYLLDLDELPDLERRLWPWFGVDRRARPLSLRTHDHFRTEVGTTLRERLDACLRREGVEPPGGRVLVQTSVRVLGYVFNPVSLWFCHDRDDRLQAIVMEVNNTYGETYPYVLRADEQAAEATLPGGTWTATRTKRFHVSPFLALGLRYDVQIGIPHPMLPADGAGRPPVPVGGEPMRFVVRVTPPGGGVPFVAVQRGRRVPLTRRSLLAAQLTHPLIPQRTIGLIHWQALKLIARRVPLYQKPGWIPGQGSVAPAAPSSMPASSPTPVASSIPVPSSIKEAS
jgi:DUF1365 family protein